MTFRRLRRRSRRSVGSIEVDQHPVGGLSPHPQQVALGDLGLECDLRLAARSHQFDELEVRAYRSPGGSEAPALRHENVGKGGLDRLKEVGRRGALETCETASKIRVHEPGYLFPIAGSDSCEKTSDGALRAVIGPASRISPKSLV